MNKVFEIQYNRVKDYISKEDFLNKYNQIKEEYKDTTYVDDYLTFTNLAINALNLPVNEINQYELIDLSINLDNYPQYDKVKDKISEFNFKQEFFNLSKAFYKLSFIKDEDVVEILVDLMDSGDCDDYYYKRMRAYNSGDMDFICEYYYFSHFDYSYIFNKNRESNLEYGIICPLDSIEFILYHLSPLRCKYDFVDSIFRVGGGVDPRELVEFINNLIYKNGKNDELLSKLESIEEDMLNGEGIHFKDVSDLVERYGL